MSDKTASTTKMVIGAVSDATAIGIAPRQVSLKVGIPKHEVISELNALRQQGHVTRIGRNLWILSRYKDIRKLPGFKTPEWYNEQFRNQFGKALSKYKGKITFGQNGKKRMHRWSPYIQGFSAGFVEAMIRKYRIKQGMKIVDPFLGSGTISVCAKLHGIDSVGVEIIPLLALMAKVKTTWDLNVRLVQDYTNSVIRVAQTNAPDDLEIPFLTNTQKHFSPPVLKRLLKLRWAIACEETNKEIQDLLRLAFASILIDCSNLWRAPCLAYTDKKVSKNEVFIRFRQKIRQMIQDLSYVQKHKEHWGEAQIIEGNAQTHAYEPDSVDLAITSPPYINGIDYVLNYKIEITWLGFAKNYNDLRNLRDHMIACDNVSRITIKEFSHSKWHLNDEWIDGIVTTMGNNLRRKTISRRPDMHLVVRKYFEDVYPVIAKIYDGLKAGGRFIIVIGDSLMSGTYIPTDLILARIGKKVGFNIENIAIARNRRSGQRRDFVLKESVVVLSKKGQRKNIGKQGTLDFF